MRRITLFMVATGALVTSEAAAQGPPSTVPAAGRASQLARGLDRARGLQSNRDARSEALSRAQSLSRGAASPQSRQRVSPQDGTGRLGAGQRGASQRGLDRAAERGAGALRRPDVTGRDRANAARPDRLTGTDRRDVVSGGRNQFARTQSDPVLQQRLGQINRMRDQALETNNPEMLAQADRLEALARQQYQRRQDGTPIDAASIFQRGNTDASEQRDFETGRPAIVQTSANIPERAGNGRRPGFLKRLATGTKDRMGRFFRAVTPWSR